MSIVALVPYVHVEAEEGVVRIVGLNPYSSLLLLFRRCRCIPRPPPPASGEPAIRQDGLVSPEPIVVHRVDTVR